MIKSKLKDLLDKKANSISWMKKKIQSLRDAQAPEALTRDNSRTKHSYFYLGKMYFFFYDPKTKDKLPYYDRFPLVFPLNFYDDGFLGLNLHYLPPVERFRLLNNLAKLTNNTKYDHTTTIKATYHYLNRYTKYKAFKPCIKRYLDDHIRSKMVLINSYEWFEAVALPFERFEKQPKETVWKETQEFIKRI